MTREKYVKLRKKRLKERDERLKKQRGRIKAQREKERATRLRKWAQLAARKKRIEEQLEKARLEAYIKAEEKRREKRIKEQLLLVRKLEEKRKKARNALNSARKALKKAEEETKFSLYIPETTKKINENLTEADKNFDMANYTEAIKLSHDIKNLLKTARSEALRKAEEKRLKEEKRKKAKDAISSVRAAVEEAEKQTKLSLYVPKLTKEISETLTDAEKGIESADYAKAIKLTYEIRELVQKARLEASRKAEEKRKRRKEEPKYFYGVIPFSKGKSFGNIGLNNSEVYTIPYRDIGAIVSDSPLKDYELTEDNTRKHETALRQITKEHTVVPAEFGTTIKNERILKRLLTKAYNPTRESLNLVDNMVELGVKALLNKDIVFVDPKKRKECISNILASLNTGAKQAVTRELFSERLILNASFLVHKEDLDAFSAKVTKLQEKYPMLKLLYSGPWAPYNFVYIKIGAEGIEITKKR